MGDQHTFEDVIRAVARRKLLVTAAVLAFALLGAAYGRLTTSSSSFAAEVSFSVGDSNAVSLGPDDPLRPDPPSAPAEADRLAARLVPLAGADHEDVSVRPTVSGSAVIVKALGSTAAEAEQLATATAEAFVNERRTAGRAPFAAAAAARQAQVDDLTDQIADLDEQIVTASDATTLELRRAQLVDQKFQADQAARIATGNAEGFDAGLSQPVLVEPAVAAARSGWIVFGIVGAILGWLVGVGAAMVAASIDHRLRSRSDVERVAEGIAVVGVVPKGRPDEQELEAVEARVRGLGDQQPIVFVLGDPGETAPSGLLDALVRAAGEVDVTARVTGNERRPAVIGVRSGVTKDVDLAASVSDLEARGTKVLGVLVWDVPPRDVDWARRPLVVRG